MRTFLFSDLRDYTVFIETRGDEAATKMLRASRRVVRDAVAEHHGAEIKTEGDSFYVVFRSPSSAVRCAIEIQKAAARHTERHPDLPVRMGVGINTGEAIPHDKGYVGAAVVVAARLSTAAKPGQILVTDTVRALMRTGAHAVMRDLGAWTLKGIAQPVRVYEVDTSARAKVTTGPGLRLPTLLELPRSDPKSGVLICDELVQREGSLAALREHLDAAGKGESRIVAVSGEAGIGKTRLCRELARTAHEHGYTVLAGRAHAAGAPYGPFVSALRPYAETRGVEILRPLLGPLTSELGRLLPELVIPDRTGDHPIPPDERRDRFFRTIQLLLEDAASQRPLLLVLDDLHEADASSRELLRSIAIDLRAPSLIVLTYREDEVLPGHPLALVLGEIERARKVAQIRLRPLDADGIRRMAECLVPGPTAAAISAELYERSEGVPFYVEELLKTARDSGPPARWELPRSIRDLVQVRVERLASQRGQRAVELLETLAVARLPLPYEATIGLIEGEEDEIASDLSACIEAQLLEPASSEGTYGFRHALTRDAIEASIPPQRRRQLETRVAAVLELLGVDPATLAAHFAAAGDVAGAVRHARAGAADAMRVGAYAVAIELLEEARHRVKGHPDEGAVLEELALPLQYTGRADTSEEFLTRARALADLSGDRVSVARIDIRLASALRLLGRRDEAIDATRRAIAVLGPTGGPLLAEAQGRLAELLWAQHDVVEAVRLSEQALATAREHRADHVVVSALTTLGAALTRAGDAGGPDRLEEAVRLAGDLGHPSAGVTAYLELSRARLHRGEDRSAREAAEAGLALARDSGLELAQARLLSQLTTLYINQGRYREARGAAEQAVALARPHTIAAAAARIALANVLKDQGESAAALGVLESIDDHLDRLEPDRRMSFLAVKAQALLSLGRGVEARDAARSAVETVLGTQGLGIAAFLNAADVAEALRDASWLAELRAQFDAHVGSRSTGPILALRAELDGIEASLRGEDPSGAFRSAADRWGEVGAHVRALYRRASSTASRIAVPGHARAARAELRRIRTELERTGAFRYVSAVDSVLAKKSKRPRRAPGLLAGRDLRVAMLVASGYTDARIATSLGLTERDAHRAVRGALGKLGVTSRSQLASWIIDRGSIDLRSAHAP